MTRVIGDDVVLRASDEAGIPFDAGEHCRFFYSEGELK